MSTIINDRCFTPGEAALLSGIALKRVHNAIDKHIVETTSGGTHASLRSLALDQLLLLKLWAEIGEYLNEERRMKLSAVLAALPRQSRARIDPFVTVEIAPARRAIESKLRELEAADSIVERRRSVLRGEPVFKGTRIPVRLIGDMLKDGADEAEILEGYPSLDARKVRLGALWAEAHPRRGRPRTLADRGAVLLSQTRAALKR
jgi:uncharacterized protein (DUF433 family)